MSIEKGYTEKLTRKVKEVFTGKIDTENLQSEIDDLEKQSLSAQDLVRRWEEELDRWPGLNRSDYDAGLKAAQKKVAELAETINKKRAKLEKSQDE